MVKSARKTNALPLPTGKSHATLPDIRIKAVTQFRFDEIEYLCHRTRFAQLRRINFTIRQAKRDVARNCIVDEKNILWHITDGGLPRGHQRRCKRLVVNQDLACGWLVQAKQQINQ